MFELEILKPEEEPKLGRMLAGVLALRWNIPSSLHEDMPWRWLINLSLWASQCSQTFSSRLYYSYHIIGTSVHMTQVPYS